MLRPLHPLRWALALASVFLGDRAAWGAEVDFSRSVLPLLSENCFQCHGPDAKARKADLRLDTFEGATQKNPDGAAALVPGNPDASGILQRIFSTDPEEVMPPPKSNRKLAPGEKDLLKRWIAEGGKWGVHWAFAPLKKPAIPEHTAPAPPGSDTKAHPIDALVSQRLQKENLQLQPPAPGPTLLRRLSLDLTGLPPSLEDAALFEADTAPGALERLVDRLLESPRFGERMAWDWLEAARYADSNGYQGDADRTMWPWRDWVVEAFNRNLPYDQFTLWQLAGDLLPAATQEQTLATAFLRNHPINGEGGRIAEENRVDYVMDMAETTGTVWMGLTLNCCRCHDHKYDPLSQEEYYRFFAFFNQTPVTGGGGDPQTAPRLEVPRPEDALRLQNAKSALESARAEALEHWKNSHPQRTAWADTLEASDLKKTLAHPEAKWSAPQRKTVEDAWEKNDPVFKKLRAEREARQQAFDAANRSLPRVMVMAELPKPRQTFLLERGLYTNPTREVTPGVPSALPPLPQASDNTPPNRLDLARWLVSPDHPLTARVTVNRLWQQFFGIGLVKTVEDFGVQAETPVHRDLLDWLAADFVESQWNLKKFIRQIVTSQTYLQSSAGTAELAERDPQNRLLARGARFRMPSWMIRDQSLALSGLMTPQIGGPPVKPYQPEGIWEEATFGNKKYVRDTGPALYRRSLYTFWRRIIGPTVFFDTGNRTTCSVKPLRTNTPLHALATLNETTQVEAARTLAQRLLQGSAKTPESRIQETFQRVLARKPAPEETGLFSKALEKHLAHFNANPMEADKLLKIGDSPRNPSLTPTEHAAYTVFCLSIFNLDETLTRE